MATHSSILAWEIPWTEEPGVLQPMGSQKVRDDLATKKQQQGIITSYSQSCCEKYMHTQQIHLRDCKMLYKCKLSIIYT